MRHSKSPSRTSKEQRRLGCKKIQPEAKKTILNFIKSQPQSTAMSRHHKIITQGVPSNDVDEVDEAKRGRADSWFWFMTKKLLIKYYDKNL